MKNIHRSLTYMPGVNQIRQTYKDFNNKCKHYVLWSGGYDSTLVLYELLNAYGAENVIAISYRYPWLDPTKYENEKNHREAIKAKLKLRGKEFSNFTHVEFDISQTAINGDLLRAHSNMGLPQAAAWLLSIPLYVENHSCVYDGTIHDDDLTFQIDAYYKTFRNVSKIINKDIYLRQPYLYLNKSEILEKIFQYDLYEECWFCEMPVDIGKICCECKPCKTHLSALTVLSLTTKDEMVRMKALKEIDKIRNMITNRKDEVEMDECEDKEG